MDIITQEESVILQKDENTEASKQNTMSLFDVKFLEHSLYISTW